MLCQPLSSLSTCVGQESTRQEYLSFPWREASAQLQLLTCPGNADEAVVLTSLQKSTQVWELPLVSLSYSLIIGRIDERERYQALSDQIAAMDAGERFGNDAADSELSGSQYRMFPAGTLAIVVTADDEASTPFPCPLGKL